MNMLEEAYREEILRQIDHIGMEIIALTNDYNMLSDDICKSQVKTFLEKKYNKKAYKFNENVGFFVN